MARMAEHEHETTNNREMVAYLESELRDACELLTEVCDRGLIYWEPNTTTGAVNKALMIARIDRWLTAHGRTR